MLRDEIGKCMSGLAETDGEVSARFRFPAAFEGFRGHFPGNPVLPGVCLVQAALVLFERHRGSPARLRRIASAKFMQPVTPDAELCVAGRAEPRAAEAGEEVLKVRVRRGAARVAELVLHVSDRGPGT